MLPLPFTLTWRQQRLKHKARWQQQDTTVLVTLSAALCYGREPLVLVSCVLSVLWLWLGVGKLGGYHSVCTLVHCLYIAAKHTATDPSQATALVHSSFGHLPAKSQGTGRWGRA